MKYILLAFFALLHSLVQAQYIPVENIYVSTDKTVYEFSDTIRVEGQVVRMDNDSTMVPYSQYAYVELVNNTDSVVSRKKVVCDRVGGFVVYLPIDPFLKKGDYYIRSFTKFMANYSAYTFPVSRIFLGLHPERETGKQLTCNFYPEGGNGLIPGVAQNVGIKVEDDYGFPVPARIALLTQQGDTIQRLQATPNGWQVLRFLPQEGMHYNVLLQNEQESSLIALPLVEDNVSVQTTLRNLQLITRIQKPAGRNLEGWKLCVSHPSIGLQLLPVTRNVLVSNLDGVSDGLISVFLLNASGKVVAQSSRWYASRKPLLNLESIAWTDEGISAHWNQPLDSLATVFYRVTPEQLDAPNAESLLKYENSLQSSEAYPASTAERTALEARIDEEGWLYSAKYCRLDIENVLKNGLNLPALPEHELVIKGQVSQKNVGKLKDGSMVIYQTGNRSTYTGMTDRDARFCIPVKDFPEGESFFVEAYNKQEKAGIYEYEFLSDTLPGVRIRKYAKQVYVENEKGQFMGAFSFDGDNKLPEVVVKARVMQERPKDETRAFYKNKYISEETMNDRHFASFQQVVDYFFVYMKLLDSSGATNAKGGLNKDNVVLLGGALIDIVEGGKRYNLVNRRRSDEIKILLDSSLITADEAMSLNMDEIATVEYFSPSESLRYAAHAYGGVLILTTKKHKQEKPVSKGIYYQPPFGIANYHAPREEDVVMMPDEPGQYTVYVDVISPVYGIRSFVQRVKK